MPSIRGMTPAQRLAAVRSGKVRISRRTSRPQFRYKRGTKIGANRRATRGTSNITQLSTLSKKTENLSISYRNQLNFTDMGYDAGSTPVLIRVNLNNPTFNGAGATQINNIVSVVGSLRATSVNPTFTAESLDNKKNLHDRLLEYMDMYRTAIVTSAEVTFNVRPKLNQVGQSEDGQPPLSIIPYLTNQAGSGDNDPHLAINPPNLDGSLNIWCIRQSGEAQLYDSTTVGTFPLSTLKQSVPGMRMSKLNVTPTSTKGMTYKLVYTPKTQFGIGQVNDNKEILKFTNGIATGAGGVPTPVKKAYAYLGIAGSKPASQNYKPCNVVVECVVKYTINFSERKNEPGNNEPVPHTEL